MIHKELIYTPNLRRCESCFFAREYCGGLVFKEMPRISKGEQDGIVIVKCTHYINQKQDEKNEQRR